MICNNNFDKSIIRKFKKHLDEINFELLCSVSLGNHIHFSDPLPNYRYIEKEVNKLPSEIVDIVRFYIMGMPIKIQDLLNYLDKEIIDYFVDMKIFKSDNGYIWLNNYLLVSYHNCYLIVSNVYYYPTCTDRTSSPYIGQDTFWLSDLIINRVSGRILDLCTGSGIQAIIAAKTSTHVDAVDIDNHALVIAQINAIINGVEEKISFYMSNLYEAIGDVKYDYILSNPPFIPIPNNVEFPLAGDGGCDGKAIIRRILSGVKHHLNRDGQVIMIGQTIGNDKEVFLNSELKDYLSEISYNIYYSQKMLLREQATNFAELVKNLYGMDVSPDLWMNYYNKINANYLYKFVLCVKQQDECIYKQKIHTINDAWSYNDVPNLQPYKKIESKLMTTLSTSNGSFVCLDEDVVYFLKLCDGEKSIADIVENMPLIYKEKYGNDLDLMGIHYMNMCSQLERMGLISNSCLGGYNE